MKKLTQPDPASQLTLFSSERPQETMFDRIKRTDEHGNEYWSARELMPIMQYTDWRNFHDTIKRAIVSCDKSGNGSINHFGKTNKLIDAGKGAKRKVDDYKLSRLACYLVAMNGDTSKPVIADAQSYFAGQTRRQEIADQKTLQQKHLRRDQDVTLYQLQGHNADWSAVRVDSKASQKALNAVLLDTHEAHKPNFAEIASIQTELFNMTRREIIAYLGLLPKDEDKYRDRLGEYALSALDQVNRTARLRMTSLKRELTTEEQAGIVRHVVAIVGPSMRELAQYAQVDFISGAPLNERGIPQLVRNQKLLKG